MFAGKNQGDMQIQNRSTVLRILHAKGHLSRKELSRLSGLTPSTITNIIKDWQESGLVVENGSAAGARGRNQVMLEINPDCRYVVGIQLARDYIAGGLFNLNVDLLKSERIAITGENTMQELLRKMKGMTWRLLGDEATTQKTAAIGIGTPGPLSISEGKITYASNFPGCRNIPIKQIFEDEFNIRTVIEHDADTAALAEKLFGAGRNADNLIFVAAGAGVGAGVILNGEIYHGTSSTAGEIGHMTIDFQGPRCECGNYGCLELYCSSQAVCRQARKMLQTTHRNSALSACDTITPANIATAVRTGDAAAIALVTAAASQLGYGIVSIINLLHPDLVILGDEMSQCGEIWIDSVRKAAVSRLMPELAAQVKISGASLRDPFLYGSGAVAIESLFEDPNQFHLF